MKIIITALFIIQNLFFFSQNTTNEIEEETKSLFEVKIDSTSFTIEEGQEIRIDGELKNPKISIKLLEIKKFSNDNISFEYPTNFSYEVEKAEGYKNWTLDGNDFVIMIFDIDGETSVRDFIDNMIIQFGEENCSKKTIETKLGGKKIKGAELNVELIGQKLNIKFYKYSSTQNNSKYIAFQEVLDENGDSSAEGVNTVKLIDKTIVFK